MPIDLDADLEITGFAWVPRFAQGNVRDLRPRWACEEFGLPYKVRLISAVERPAWYYHEQPWGQVPFLRDGAIGLFESGAALLHLAEKADALPPPMSQQRARVFSWLLAAFNSVEPSVLELANVDVFSRKEEWAALRRPSLLGQISGRLSRLEDALGEAEWLADAFSIADIAMVTVLRALPDRTLTAPYPRLEAYLRRAQDRPPFQRALASQMEPYERHAPMRQQEGA